MMTGCRKILAWLLCCVCGAVCEGGCADATMRDQPVGEQTVEDVPQWAGEPELSDPGP
jgi:hypothetical protein